MSVMKTKKANGQQQQQQHEGQQKSKPNNKVIPSTKRVISVVAPEEQNGNVEYKRQLHQTSPSRLRSLATQMSYRLDEGNGICTYRLGVEDDGCHSLLDYSRMAESARILECIARSLNAVVLERKMIQNEVVTNPKTGEAVLKNKADANEKDGVIVSMEPSVFGYNGMRQQQQHQEDSDEEEKKAGSTDEEIEDNFRIQQLNKEAGFFTRAEVKIQRVETHLLDPSPISLVELAASTANPQASNGSSNGEITNNSDASKTQPGSPTKTTESKVTEQNSKQQPSLSMDAKKPEEDLSVGETLSARNIRVAVVGNVDAGKSTLIGTLTTSCLDDGRGRSRTSIMKHRHEIESGRTSTSSTHLMGFKSTGQPVAGRDKIKTNKRKTEDEVARESYRIITLMDLAGHEKYLKTTIHGVSSGFSDYALILVNSRHPPTHMTQHHLNLCCSFGIPVIVVFTKIDGCPEHAYKTSKKEVVKLLRSPEIGKKPFMVRNEDDVETCIGKLHTLAPMIETSCVTGQGIELLNKLLFTLPKRRRHENKAKRAFEFLVEDIFNVPGVGGVVSGFVNAGELTVGSNCHVYVGPVEDGTFMKTVAKSAHISRINTGHITSGQSACIAFSLNKEMRKKLRRGMVVLKENPSATKQFDAEICVLKGEGTTIRRSYQAYVHILNVRQSAYARSIEIVNHNVAGLPPSHSACREPDDEAGTSIVLRPGSRAKVRFEFAQRPEYIRPGMRMLFRDGRVRGVGIITAIPEVAPVK